MNVKEGLVILFLKNIKTFWKNSEESYRIDNISLKYSSFEKKGSFEKLKDDFKKIHL